MIQSKAGPNDDDTFLPKPPFSAVCIQVNFMVAHSINAEKSTREPGIQPTRHNRHGDQFPVTNRYCSFTPDGPMHLGFAHTRSGRAHARLMLLLMEIWGALPPSLTHLGVQPQTLSHRFPRRRNAGSSMPRPRAADRGVLYTCE